MILLLQLQGDDDCLTLLRFLHLLTKPPPFILLVARRLTSFNSFPILENRSFGKSNEARPVADVIPARPHELEFETDVLGTSYSILDTEAVQL